MFELFIFNSFFIIGISYVFSYELDTGREGSPTYKIHPIGLLGKLGHFIEELIPEWLFTPLLGCVKCMPTIWGTLIFWGYVITQGIEIEPLLFVKFVGYHLSLVGTGHIYGSITEGK